MANTPNLWGMFVSAGYLTVVKAIDPKKEKFRIAIPNYEVRRGGRSHSGWKTRT